MTDKPKPFSLRISISFLFILDEIMLIVKCPLIKFGVYKGANISTSGVT